MACCVEDQIADKSVKIIAELIATVLVRATVKLPAAMVVDFQELPQYMVEKINKARISFAFDLK